MYSGPAARLDSCPASSLKFWLLYKKFQTFGETLGALFGRGARCRSVRKQANLKNANQGNNTIEAL